MLPAIPASNAFPVTKINDKNWSKNHTTRNNPSVVPDINKSNNKIIEVEITEKNNPQDGGRKNIASTYELDKLALDSLYPANHNKKRSLKKLPHQRKISTNSAIKSKLDEMNEEFTHSSLSGEYNFAGDVVVRKGPTPKLLENSFAASITAVKPSRRVANVLPAQVA